MPNRLYYEAYLSPDRGWKWKIYHYDSSGNREIIDHRSPDGFDTKADAEDDCCDFQDDHGIDAELS